MLNETMLKKFLQKYVIVPEEIITQFDDDLNSVFEKV